MGLITIQSMMKLLSKRGRFDDHGMGKMHIENSARHGENAGYNIDLHHFKATRRLLATLDLWLVNVFSTNALKILSYTQSFCYCTYLPIKSKWNTRVDTAEQRHPQIGRVDYEIFFESFRRIHRFSYFHFLPKAVTRDGWH